MQIDNFLDDYPLFRHHCNYLNYEGIHNPVDGVFYPGISLDIPDDIKQEVKIKLEHEFGEVSINFMFLRLSTKDTKAPHQSHTDDTMGNKSLMLYLNREEDCAGGTSLVTHENGLCATPTNEEDLAVWEEDHSKPEKWSITNLCEMAPNKACIFDARLMHRAEPVGGFGENEKDGRLVLTAFFQ